MEGQGVVIVLFQRYGDDVTTWTAGAPASNGLRMTTPSTYFTYGDPNVIDPCVQIKLELYERVIKNYFKCHSGFDT